MRPASFGFNAETAACNVFQSPPEGLNEPGVAYAALKEFERFATTLNHHGVHVHVIADTPDPPKPDAVFPNNWLTMHHDGRVLLYPMCAPNRRWERRRDIVESLQKFFHVSSILDLSHYELRGSYLEGTGSVVFDHKHRLAFACLSRRTDNNLLQHLGEILGYRPVTFHATDPSGREIYHTNVMMSVGDGYAVVCLESIREKSERDMMLQALAATDKDVID